MLRVVFRGRRGLVAAAFVVALLVSVLPLRGGAGAQQASPVLAFASGGSLADVGTAASLVASGGADAVVQVGADGLSDAAAGVVRSAAPRRAVIVGGISAVPTAVQERIETLSPGVSITRLDGADREQTAVLAAQRALAGKSDVTVALANGGSLADVGVAASLVAAGGADAVLYTSEDGISEDTAAALRQASVAKLIAVGGLAALSQATADAAQAAAGVSTPQRLDGDTRVETAARVARSAAGDCTDTVVLTNGWSPADVGTAATLAAALDHSAVLYAQSADTAGAATVSAITRLDPVRLVLIGDTDTLTDSLAASLTQNTPRTLTRYTDPADTTTHALAHQDTACETSANTTRGSSSSGSSRDTANVTPQQNVDPQQPLIASRQPQSSARREECEQIGNTDPVDEYGWGQSPARDAFTTSFQSCFPHNVRQTRTGAGILLEWDAPTDGHAQEYEIYRFDEDGVAGTDNKDERYSIGPWPWPNIANPEPPNSPELAGRFATCLEVYQFPDPGLMNPRAEGFDYCDVDTVAKEPIFTTTDTSWFDPRGVVESEGARWVPGSGSDLGHCATDTCLQEAQHFAATSGGSPNRFIYSRGDLEPTLPGQYRYYVVAVDSQGTRDSHPPGARCNGGTVGPELSPCTKLITYKGGQSHLTVLSDSPGSFVTTFDPDDGSFAGYSRRANATSLADRATSPQFSGNPRRRLSRVHWPSQVWDGGNWSADWSDGSWNGYTYRDVSMPGIDYGLWHAQGDTLTYPLREPYLPHLLLRPFVFDEVKMFATVSSSDGTSAYVEVPLTAEHQATKQFATDPSNPAHSELILQPGQTLNWTVYAQVKAGDGPFVAKKVDLLQDCAGVDGLPPAQPGEPACISNYKEAEGDDGPIFETHVIDDWAGGKEGERTLSANSDQIAGTDIATTADKVCFAQSFTVGAGTDGFRLNSVEIGTSVATGVTASVTIRPDANGVPHGNHFEHLHAKLIIPTLDQDTATSETFVATDTTSNEFGELVSPAYVRLEAGATYWVSVCNLDGSDTGLSVATTASDGHDTGGFGDWAIGDNVYVYNNAATPPAWADFSDTAFGTDAVHRNIKIKLIGWSNTRTDGKAPGVTASDLTHVTHRGTQSGSAYYRE